MGTREAKLWVQDSILVEHYTDDEIDEALQCDTGGVLANVLEEIVSVETLNVADNVLISDTMLPTSSIASEEIVDVSVAAVVLPHTIMRTKPFGVTESVEVTAPTSGLTCEDDVHAMDANGFSTSVELNAGLKSFQFGVSRVVIPDTVSLVADRTSAHSIVGYSNNAQVSVHSVGNDRLLGVVYAQDSLVDSAAYILDDDALYIVGLLTSLRGDVTSKKYLQEDKLCPLTNDAPGSSVVTAVSLVMMSPIAPSIRNRVSVFFLSAAVARLKSSECNIAKLVVHLIVFSFDKKSNPSLAEVAIPFPCCNPMPVVAQWCHFVVLQTPLQAEAVEFLAVKEPHSAEDDTILLSARHSRDKALENLIFCR